MSHRSIEHKKTFDFVVSVILLFLLSPIFIIIAVLIRWQLGAPIFFKQARPGLNGKPFTILKFRTMLDAVDANGKPLPDAQRLTKFGRFLRTTSLDVLPELINVLRGEMSLVGPRPLLMHYLPLYSAEQLKRHDVLPGITGRAQINGRNAISWDQKFNHDLWYIKNQSFWLDLKILFLPAWKIIKRNDINQPGHVTIAQFTGNET